TPEEEEAASQLLGMSADANLPEGRTCKVFVQGGWMFSAAARRNMELAEVRCRVSAALAFGAMLNLLNLPTRVIACSQARRQNSKIATSLFNKHKAELFKIAVRCAGPNKDRKKGELLGKSSNDRQR